MKRATFGLAAALTLSGCMIAEPPVPPGATVTPAADWRTPSVPGSAIASDWWTGYGDHVLTALIERGLDNNTDVAIAAARLREAAADARLARAQLLPNVGGGVAAAHSRSLSPFGTATTGSSAEAQAQVAWEIDLFGRLADLEGAARARYLASAAARDATELAVAATIAGDYVVLRGLDAQLQVAKDTLAARTEGLRLAQSQAEAGFTSMLELNQARAEYEATAEIVPQVERAISLQENALSVLLGDNPRAIERGLELTSLTAPPVPAGLPSELLRRRPDIAEAEYRLAASDRNLAAQRKGYLPSIQLTGSGGVLVASALADPVGLFSLGGSVLAPIFDAGRAQANADAAAAQRDQAAFAYRGVVLTAFREVEDSLARLNYLDSETVHARAQRDALAEALRHATNRYRAGYADYLTQLDAQRGLLSAELELIRLETAHLGASIDLYRAMGGGWQRDP